MTEMFNVINRQNRQITRVYGVQDDSNGYPRFLIRKGNQWIWKSAKLFIPIEAEGHWKNILDEDDLK